MNNKVAVRVVVLAFVLTVFLVIGIKDRLLADFHGEYWQSFITRLVLVAGAGLFMAWRLQAMAFLETAMGRRRFVFCSLVLFLLAAPLLGQLSFFRKSIKDVSIYLYGQKEGGVERVLHLARNFPGTYKMYVDQHFRLPHWYVQFNALVKVHLFRISPNDTITLGKEGFYFEGMGASRVEKEIVENFDNIADYMGQIPFSEEELRQWKRALEQRRYWLRARGSEFVFVLAPTKAFVYPEFLPNRLQRVRGTSRYTQLSQYLRDYADIPFIDLLPALLEAKEEQAYPLLFYKTDFHWNFYGAFIAYQTMLREMAGFFPQYTFPVPELSDFELRIDENWAHQRFMYMLGLPLRFHSNEHHITMVPRPGGLYDEAQDIPSAGIYDVELPRRAITAPDGLSMNIRLILNPVASIPSLVLLGDSFLEKCVLFFSANARRVLNQRTVVDFPHVIFHYEQPDIVVQEILNMFILRAPPQNPRHLEIRYLEEKFKANKERTLFEKGADDTGITVPGDIFPGASFDLSHLPENQRGEMRVAAIGFHAVTEGQVSLTLLHQDGTESVPVIYQVPAGDSVRYLEMPADSPSTLLVTAEKEASLSVVVRSLQIRSDLHRH
jgi:hypothetical protein